MVDEQTTDASDMPQMLGHYEMQGQIGQGGMAVVYKGVQPSLNRVVAVKVLPERFARTPEMVERFEREANIAAQLKHPNIVQIIDRGKDGGILYIVMEYIDGESLDKAIGRGSMPLPRVIDYSNHILDALQYAHEKGVIHRDLKPSNILIDNETGLLKITDFGIAQFETDGLGLSTLTGTNTALGTMNYMSPEQRLDSHRVNHQTDIFAFGVMLYEMLTGRLPLGHFKMPSLIRSDIPMGMDTIVAKCLAESPSDRYNSASEIKSEIGQLTGRYRRLRNAATVRKIRGKRSKKRVPAMVAAAVLVLGGAAAAFFGLRSGDADEPVTGNPTPSHHPAQPEPPKPVTPVAPAEPATPEHVNGGTQEPETAPSSEPKVTAAELLKTASEAFAAGDAEKARKAAEQVKADFKGSDDAAAAEKLLAQIDKRIKDLATLVETAKALVAKPEAVEMTYKAAIELLDKAAPAFPGMEERIAQEKAAITVAWDAAYKKAVESGNAALKESKWDEATAAFAQAKKVRGGKEAEGLLAGVTRAKELAAFKAAPDTQARLGHLVRWLEMDGVENAKLLLAQARELASALDHVQPALKEAKPFREKMPAAQRASAAEADAELAAAEKAIAELAPPTMREKDLSDITTKVKALPAAYGKAVEATLMALYPGLKADSPAEQLPAAYMAHRDFSKSSTAGALYKKAFPDDSLVAIARILAETPRKASPDKLPDVTASLTKAAGECERLAKAGNTAVPSLQRTVLMRRSEAYASAGKPAEALADAAAHLVLTPDNATAEKLLDTSAAAFVALVKKADAQAIALLQQLSVALPKEAGDAVRNRLAEAAQDAAFEMTLMRNRPLLKAWAGAVRPIDPSGMVRVAAGTFPVGTAYDGPAALTPSSAPRHNVEIGEFYVDAHEVTNVQFKAFVDAGGYTSEDLWDKAEGLNPAEMKDATGKPSPRYWQHGAFAKGEDNHPVVGISWYEARAYARWVGKRLPTEAEWECAAAGSLEDGKAAYAKRDFPWGERYEEGKANLKDAKNDAPSGVGAWPHDKSPSGCYDMLGNVREWTADAYVAYPTSACSDKDFARGLIAVRGRSYADSSLGAELTSRWGEDKMDRGARTGFRCAFSMDKE